MSGRPSSADGTHDKAALASQGTKHTESLITEVIEVSTSGDETSECQNSSQESRKTDTSGSTPSPPDRYFHRQVSINAAIKPCVSSWVTSGVDVNNCSKNVFDILNIHRKIFDGETFDDLIDNGYILQPARYTDMFFSKFVKHLRSVMPLDLEEVYNSPCDCPILPISLVSPDTGASCSETNAQKRKDVLLKIASSWSKLQAALEEGTVPPQLIGFFEAAVDFLVELEEMISRQPKNPKDAPKEIVIQELFCAFCKMANVKLSVGKAYERQMNVLGIGVKSEPDLRILSPCHQDKFRWSEQMKQQLQEDKPCKACPARTVNAVIEVKRKISWDVENKHKADGMKFIEKDVGGQLLGEMLLDLHASATSRTVNANQERILGILVQCTKVAFVELTMPCEHYHAIRENDQANLQQGTMTVSKVYDMVKNDDRIPLLNLLNKVSRIIS